MNQHTIKQPIKTKGVGLHTGTTTSMKIFPAPENTGIVFIKKTKSGPLFIPVLSQYVTNTTLSTDIGKDQESIRTIEHLMSALAGCSIDNVYIEIEGDEIPALDGSASPFCFLIREAGIIEQSEPKKFLKINKTVKVGDENGWAMLEPYDGFSLDFTIDFDHPLIKRSTYSIDINHKNYWKQISRARTFGFIKDTEKLHKSNAALGASTQNTIVLREFDILNKEGLRYPNEFVRHKILDAIGDLYVSGYQIMGKYTAYASGHRINDMLLQGLFEKNAGTIIQPTHLNSVNRNYNIHTGEINEQLGRAS